MALQAIVRCVGVQYRNHYKESVLHVAMGWRRTAEMTKQTYTRSNLEQKITYSTASVIDGSAMARSLNAVFSFDVIFNLSHNNDHDFPYATLKACQCSLDFQTN